MGNPPQGMKTVNIHAAKTHLSSLVEEAAEGEEIIIAKTGKPVARVAPLENLISARHIAFLGAGSGSATISTIPCHPRFCEVLALSRESPSGHTRAFVVAGREETTRAPHRGGYIKFRNALDQRSCGLGRLQSKSALAGLSPVTRRSIAAAPSFDRMLVAQAQCEGLTLVTADPKISAYDVPILDALK